MRRLLNIFSSLLAVVLCGTPAATKACFSRAEIFSNTAYPTPQPVLYGFDPVGNRTNRTSAVSVIGSQTPSYNANDWLASDTSDANGNTTVSGTTNYQYDVVNHLVNVNNGQILLTYDGDGNRVSKTVNGLRTYYLVDDRNPSGYAQVLEEYTFLNQQPAALSRVYNYGLALISQRQVASGAVSYFGTDGHGSTRFLTDANANLTDTYAFDAYGLLIASTGSTPNNYLYCGQQWDSDLGFYYLRARYYKPDTGRFWTMDTYGGDNEDPLSLHKYLYAQASPIDLDDPTGNYSSWEQFMGYEAQDAIVDHYKDTHPWINPNDILSDAHVPVKSRKYTYLKPDIINKATKQWLEIKPLSPWGIAKGLAKYKLDKTLLKGYSADAGWTPLLELETDSGEAILVVNCGGVVYWIDKDFVTDSAGFAAGVAAGAVADQLLKYVAQQVAVRSLAPMAARATAFLAEAFSADVGASLGVASLNSLEAGAP